MPGIVGIATCFDPVPQISSDGTRVLNVDGRFDVVRQEGDVTKSYRYLLLERRDGSATQVGPFKDLDYEHHRSGLPPWLQKLRMEER